jgi:hypothetical protein
MNSRSYTSASPSPLPVIRQRIVQFMLLAARSSMWRGICQKIVSSNTRRAGERIT